MDYERGMWGLIPREDRPSFENLLLIFSSVIIPLSAEKASGPLRVHAEKLMPQTGEHFNHSCSAGECRFARVTSGMLACNHLEDRRDRTARFDY